MVDKFSEVSSAPDGIAMRMTASRRPDMSDLDSRSKPYPVSPSAPPSTGGTTEPNDAPVGDMFFRTTDSNPFVDTSEDKLSTFALDVDTGSWSLARSYLERGSLPPAEAIRVEEFVNAQTYDDPAPRRGDFTLVAEGAPSPFVSPGDYRLLRFAVKGRELAASQRKPAVLTFVVDVSGSMARENRLGLVKHALGLLLDELASDDRVGLVVYGSQGRVLLEHTSEHERIRRAIDSLRPEGSTNAEEGLRLGYDLAGEAYQSDWNNRVVLCSDGVANVGATGPESILERIGREARRGIELTTVGFGMGNYNDALMEQLADQGDGRYHYVDTEEEARRIFVADLSGTLETIAKDAKVQVELDPATVERWRLLGYENRDVADRDFRNDRIDAGEIGAGHSATALYEIRLAPRVRRNDAIGTLRLRWRSAATGSVEEASLTLHVRDLEPSFGEASNNLRRAAVAAELAEILKQSFYAKDASWSTLVEEARRLEPGSVREEETDDLRGMIERASDLQ
jgi:Ca-activated chloride channel family protein